MGVNVVRVEFPGEPPSEAELRAYLLAQAADESGLSGYAVEGHRVELECMIDPYTFQYALAFLAGRGATLFDVFGNRFEVELPEYLRTPWRSLPWWRRLVIRIRWPAGLSGRRSGTAGPSAGPSAPTRRAPSSRAP